MLFFRKRIQKISEQNKNYRDEKETENRKYIITRGVLLSLEPEIPPLPEKLLVEKTSQLCKSTPSLHINKRTHITHISTHSKN